jgi:hypothetical protein
MVEWIGARQDAAAMSTTLTAPPESLAGGTTLAYRRSHTAYPADQGWALELFVVGPEALRVAGVAAGSDFDVTLTAVETGALPAGTYSWVERVTKGSEVYDAARGVIAITPNLATAGPGSLLSWEEKTLPIVEAAIAGQLTSGIADYQIGGRSVSKIPLKELIPLRSKLQDAVARITSGGRRRQILVGFNEVGTRT